MLKRQASTSYFPLIHWHTISKVTHARGEIQRSSSEDWYSYVMQSCLLPYRVVISGFLPLCLFHGVSLPNLRQKSMSQRSSKGMKYQCLHQLQCYYITTPHHARTPLRPDPAQQTASLTPLNTIQERIAAVPSILIWEKYPLSQSV